MPWTGSAPNESFQRTDGTRTGSTTWAQADNAGVKILSSAHDTHDEDIADGLNECLKKDGGNQASADIPMGGFTLTNIADAGGRTEPLAAGQAADGSANWYGNLSGTDTYTLSGNGFTPTSYTQGMVVYCRAVNANTGAVTVNVNGLGATAVVKTDGAALAAGDWAAGAVVSLIYDTNLGNFVWGGYPNQLDDDTVTTGALADAAVTEAKLASALQTLLDQIRQKIGIGAGRFVHASATQCKLVPYNGELVSFPNGTQMTIPFAGLMIANTGLASSTAYYCYAYDNSGALALELSTTGHATDAMSGIEIKAGDATRVLVGAVLTSADSPGQFRDDVTGRQVASWHNRRPQQLQNAFTAERSITGTSFVEVNSEIRCELFSWGDALSASFAGSTNNASSGTWTGLSIDGSTTDIFTTLTQTSTAGGQHPGNPGGVFLPSEGAHFLTILARNSGGTSLFRVSEGQGKLSASVVI